MGNKKTKFIYVGIDQIAGVGPSCCGIKIKSGNMIPVEDVAEFCQELVDFSKSLKPDKVCTHSGKIFSAKFEYIGKCEFCGDCFKTRYIQDNVATGWQNHNFKSVYDWFAELLDNYGCILSC